jgi:SNF2 family DNA or RNA helicase
MIYLEISYAHRNEAKLFGVRWDPKVKLWYFPGEILPVELERFRPANGAQSSGKKIILDIPFSYREIATKAGAQWDSERKVHFFEKQPLQTLPLELEGFEPKEFSWEEKIQRELNGEVPTSVPAQKSIALRSHQLKAVESIYQAYQNGYPGFLLADDVGLGKTFAAWAGILRILESARENWKILIVCPLGVVANWRSSIQWMGTSRWAKEVVILNYERLGKIFEGKPRKGAKKLSKRDLSRRGVASEEFEIVLFDESHALKNLDSLRTKFPSNYIPARK